MLPPSYSPSRDRLFCIARHRHFILPLFSKNGTEFDMCVSIKRQGLLERMKLFYHSHQAGKTLWKTVPFKNTPLYLRADVDSDALVPSELHLIVALGKKTGSCAEKDFFFFYVLGVKTNVVCTAKNNSGSVLRGKQHYSIIKSTLLGCTFGLALCLWGQVGGYVMSES